MVKGYLLTLLALTANEVLAQEPSKALPPAPAHSRLRLQTSPIIDLYFRVRFWATTASAKFPQVYEGAVEAARALDEELGGIALAWGPLEGLLLGCNTARELESAFLRAPEEFKLRSGRMVKLRAGGARLAQELTQVEADFLSSDDVAPSLWQQDQVLLHAEEERWQAQVQPKERELLAAHLTDLGIEDPALEVPIYLVVRLPAPGAITHLSSADRGVCFVGIDGLPGSQLFEIVLHEATHAFDVATREHSFFAKLRQALEQAGIGPSDSRYRDLPHTIMFVQAAASIRRSLDSMHEDYGTLSGYYARLGASAELIRGVWGDYLMGEQAHEGAIAAIVAGALAMPRAP